MLTIFMNNVLIGYVVEVTLMRAIITIERCNYNTLKFNLYFLKPVPKVLAGKSNITTLAYEFIWKILGMHNSMKGFKLPFKFTSKPLRCFLNRFPATLFVSKNKDYFITVVRRLKDRLNSWFNDFVCLVIGCNNNSIV